MICNTGDAMAGAAETSAFRTSCTGPNQYASPWKRKTKNAHAVRKALSDWSNFRLKTFTAHIAADMKRSGTMHAAMPMTTKRSCSSLSQHNTDGNHATVLIRFGCSLHCKGPNVVVTMDTKKAITTVPIPQKRTGHLFCQRWRCCTNADTRCAKQMITRKKKTAKIRKAYLLTGGVGATHCGRSKLMSKNPISAIRMNSLLRGLFHETRI
mmetsp:Transcript_62322/g.148796  ORF Transcript_62322/g.148796 Transcript_62322/m.148796 type:complete len:210 (-) Transcript_62322:1026-1655(-)